MIVEQVSFGVTAGENQGVFVHAIRQSDFTFRIKLLTQDMTIEEFQEFIDDLVKVKNAIGGIHTIALDCES